jgi:hypothetical protein
MPFIRFPAARLAAFVGALALLPGPHPAGAQTATLELVARLDVPAALVELAGDYAYVAGGETFQVVDVSDPARPAALGTFTAPGPIWAFHVAAPHVYLTAGLEGLYIIDVSDPRAPVLAGTHRTAGQALGVTTSGTTALVVNLMTGLEVVDLSDEAAPALLQTQETPGYQWGIAGAGSRVLVVDQPSGVHLFDLSDPEAPVEQGVYVTEQPAQSVVLGDRGRAYVVYARTGRLEILDVADPAAPRLAGSYQPARSSGRFQRVAVERFTLVVPVGEDGIEVLDVTDPAAPTLAAAHDTPGNAQGAAISGDIVAVGDGDALLIFRIG